MATEIETEWQETNQELVDQQYQDYQNKNNRSFAEKVPQGTSVWRILPPRKDRPATPIQETYLHYIHHPDDLNVLVTVGVCAAKVYGKPCKGCRWVKQLRSQGKEEHAKRDAAKWHGYAGAVRLDSKDAKDEKPKILELSHGVYQKLNRLFKETVAMGGDFSHPDKGYDLVFTREGKDLNTKYDVLPARATSPLKRREALKSLPDLLTAANQMMEDGKLQDLIDGKAEAPGDFPPRDPDQKALPPGPGQPAQNADGTWTHPSLPAQGR
jgi:hypothetical protein